MIAPWSRRVRRDPAAGLGDLEAVLRGEDCPVCVRTKGAEARWLERFLDDGYLERAPMRRIAAEGGFCAFHAGRIAAVGQSATVALIYLSLIADWLPRVGASQDRRSRPVPLFPAAEACEACAHQREVERRECYFLALLIRARGPCCYGDPAIACMRHLPPLLEYLDERRVGDILASHRDHAAALDGGNAADPVLRLLLGPPPSLDPPAPPADPDCGDSADPVRRMRRRLCDLPSCAVCAEIADARTEWLEWLARASREGSHEGGKLSDVLPLCRDHVWQARAVAGPALAPTLAATVLREAGRRLDFAADAAAAYRGSRRLLDRLGRRFGAAPARRAALASLRRGRACPLCVRVREAGERALSLVAALGESADGRRAFESGYGLCVRHAMQAMPLLDASVIRDPGFRDIVARTTRARLALLRWELEEQLRRGAWQARPQRRGIESGAWLRAGARFSGTVQCPAG